MMWYLRTFEKDGDRLIAEIPMERVDVNTLRRLFGEAGDELMYHVYPVSPQIADALGEYVQLKFDFEKYDYFVDYDAD